MKKLLTILFFISHAIFLSSVFSQQKNLPLEREWSLDFEKSNAVIGRSRNQIINFGRDEHGRFFEWRAPADSQTNSTSNFKPCLITTDQTKRDTSKSLFHRKLLKENLFIINDTTEKFHLTIDPLFNFEYGTDQADSSKSFHKNTRGILVRGDIGKQFSFETSFYENQATYVDYISQFNDAYLVVPGQGRWKKFKTNGYDFAMASGYVSYSPGKLPKAFGINFQAGHGKHFIGDGYRSLLLSDNAFNYPFARITSTFGKIQYTNLYASFMNLTDGGVTTPPGTERLFQKKAANFQFLSWNIHKRIQLGFFQGLIWQASDSTNRECLKLSYASPIIYTAALSEGLNSNNNVLIGTTLKLKITNSISLYGQYMMDDFSASKNSIHNKTGFQAGAKYFDIFKIKNLHLQFEYNQIRPYAYSHKQAEQSYSHYNQSASHPLGANFKEAIAFLNYRIGNFFTEVKMNYAIIGRDSIGRNYGNNIFTTNNNAFYGINSTVNQMGQGLETTLRAIDFHIGYLVNPSTNFNIIVGISNRSSMNAVENSQTNFVYFGIRTSLSNVYYDF